MQDVSMHCYNDHLVVTVFSMLAMKIGGTVLVLLEPGGKVVC